MSQRLSRAIPAVLDFGEVSYNGRVSKRGDKMTRTCERNRFARLVKLQSIVVTTRHSIIFDNIPKCGQAAGPQHWYNRHQSDGAKGLISGPSEVLYRGFKSL